MAYTSIDDPSAHFQIATYTGTGSTQSVGNDGNSNLKPDWVWIKKRNSTGNHGVFDSTRGATKELVTNGANAEATDAQLLTQFDTDGFTVGTNSGVNGSSDTFVGWQWKANGGTTSSNTDGSITSTVQADTTAGFSIVTFTGTGSTATVGHGLGAIPAMIIQKNRDSTANWSVKHHKTTNNYDFLNLNLTSAATANDSIWTQTDPTTSVFSIGTSTAINQSGQDQVCYCFAEKQGYSKFGKYTGNGNANGTFVFTGFKPNFVMLREIGNTNSWWMFDTARDTYNTADARLAADQNSVEATGSFTNVIDFLSNGFKLRNTDSAWNRSGGTYIYMCFAENPFVTSTGIPTTAR